MIAVAVAMSLAAAVFHGTWNVLVKVSGDPIATFRRASLTAAVVANIALPLSWLVLGVPHLSIGAALLCLVSSLLETTYLWLLSAAYRRGELSSVYPIARGSAPLLSVLIGLTVLGERLTSPQLVGVGLLVMGILAVTVSQAGAPVPDTRLDPAAVLAAVGPDRDVFLGRILPRPVGAQPRPAGRGRPGA